MVSKKQIEEALAPKRKEYKAKRKRKPMTAEQKAAASERLAKARASKKPAKAKRWHPACYDEKKRFKPLDTILSWQKHAKEQASIYKRDMRGKTNKELVQASDRYRWWLGYYNDINWYLRHGDWISSYWGEQQQMATKFKIVAHAYDKNGIRKESINSSIIEEEKPKRRRRKKT